MQVYKTILVAMDCSPVDDAIVGHVADLAVQNNAEVILLHVVHSHTLDQERVMRQTAMESLEVQRDKLLVRDIKTHIVIRSGEPDVQILAQIEENNYDLVAMATHGHSFIGDILFGSVSRSLKHKISTPLLLIGPQR